VKKQRRADEREVGEGGTVAPTGGASGHWPGQERRPARGERACWAARTPTGRVRRSAKQAGRGVFFIFIFKKNKISKIYV
jgi:hypothetical protein